jgi:MoxR-like ATPase
MFKVWVSYPTFDDEFEVARRTTGRTTAEISPVLSGPEILSLQEFIRGIEVSENVIRYALAIVRQTRIGQQGIPDFVRDQLAWGAGPRAVQFLILGAKAKAALSGRSQADTSDVQFCAKPVLRHRIVVNFAAESDGVTSDTVVDQLLQHTPTAQDELLRDARFQKLFAS